MASRNKCILIYVHCAYDGLAYVQRQTERDSDTLFGFPLLVGSSVHSCLENLVFALEFIFKFILKVPCIILGSILHDWPFA
jgi:hypothetical protein